jgi:V8-like Glu-specific endopeptidase
MKYFLAFLFAILLVIGVTALVHLDRKLKPSPIVILHSSTPSIERQHAATHRIAVYDIHDMVPGLGHCSGTAIGPHALLTAQHCFHDSNLVRLDADKDPIVIKAAFLDGNDHVIYMLDHDFKDYVDIDQRALITNEPVHIWGAPGDNTDVFRIGYFQKLETEEARNEKGERVEGGIDRHLLVFILPVYPGDSGSGVFDAAGNIISVVSMSDTSADTYNYALDFSTFALEIASTE